MDVKRFWSQWYWLIILVAVKLILQMIAAGQYGFHRDEYLYLDEGHHLGWGYMEVPPMIAWLAAVIRLFGDGILWVKLFPAISGGISMVLIALMTRDLGGKKWAQMLACIAFLVVPAYLRTQHLFQPVFLNQLMWLLLMFYVIRLVKTERAGYWYAIGIVAGLGVLTKYSIAFLILGLIVGLLTSKQRHWLNRKEPYIAIGVALILSMPNLYWQYAHNFPIVAHMEELRETQLVHVQPLAFIKSQFLMLFTASLLWFPGVLAALFRKDLEQFRFLGVTYLTVLVTLLVFSGKDYYMLGIYPAMIALGAVYIEKLAGSRRWLQWALPPIVVLGALPLLPYGIPVLPIEKMKTYCAWMADHAGLEEPLIWEDGERRELPQDYADMFGWEEVAERVAAFYHSLPENERDRCHIWGGSYAHASTINYYGKKYDLPNAHSLVGSHVLWIPDENDFDTQIMIDDVRSFESSYFESVALVDSIRNPYAREPGYIYYRSKARVNIPEAWRALMKENKERWQR